MNGNRAKVYVPTPMNGISQFVYADQVVIALEDGTTWTVEYLVTQLVALLKAKGPTDE